MARAKPDVDGSQEAGTPVTSIPGLGPIRARALAKAGWTDTTALRKATIADLSAVPGITEIKARYILDYLASQVPAPATGTARRAKPADGRKPATAPAPKARKAAPSETPLQRSAREVVASAAALLRSDHAGDFNKRFARQIGKIAAAAEDLQADSAVDSVDAERITAQLRKINDLLAEAATDRPGDKRQDKLADELRDRRRKLQRVAS